MRLHKVINREVEGVVYYRWVLSIPPKDVKDLGWVDGQELETTVTGTALSVRPSERPRPVGRHASSKSLDEAIARSRFSRR
jgi:antitoxin component of MazEF toxin-antitoxin module